MAGLQKLLIQAATSGDLAELRRLKRDLPEGKGLTKPAQEAAKAGQAASVALLLDSGVDADAAGLLHAAIRPGFHDTIEEPRPGSLETVELLLDRGASLSALGGWPKVTPLALAAFAGTRRVVDLLRDRGAKTDLFEAAALGESRPVSKALEQKPTAGQALHRSGLAPLHFASASHLGSFEAKTAQALARVATLLLDHGADPNFGAAVDDHRLPPLYWACSAHNIAVLEVLLARGARASEGLSSALWNGTDAIADRLLAAGADLNFYGEHGPSLYDLTHWGQTKKVKWLLARGADPNVVGPGGCRALHAAAGRGSAPLVKLLLSHGADPNLRNHEGKTPRQVAEQRGRAAVAILLAEHGGER